MSRVTTYLRENPPLLRDAMRGLIFATARHTAARERFRGRTTPTVADLWTSVQDWRALVAFRVAEQMRGEGL